MNAPVLASTPGGMSDQGLSAIDAVVRVGPECCDDELCSLRTYTQRAGAAFGESIYFVPKFVCVVVDCPPCRENFL